MVTYHQRVRAFYDQDASSYRFHRWQRNAVARHDFESTRRALLRALAPQAGDRILEVGCGPGTWTEVIAGRCREVVALDLSPAMLALAREAVSAENVRYEQADFLAWDAPQAAFERAFSVRAFEHMADKAAALQRFYELLRPGGRLVIITKTVPSIWNGRVRILRALRRLRGRADGAREAERLFWMKRISPWAMRRALAQAGFVRIGIAPAVLRPPIFVGGESEYPLVRGRAEGPLLRICERLAERVHDAPAWLRLWSTLGSESYVAWADRPERVP